MSDKFISDPSDIIVHPAGGLLTADQLEEAAKLAEEGHSVEDILFRVSLLNALQEDGLALREIALGGPGSGWHREDGHVPGSQGGKKHKDETSVLKLTKSQRAWSGRQEDGPRMSKLETGALGEHLAILYLKQLGFKDARSLNTKGNNFALDLVHKHEAYEVKTGLASNSPSAQQWRATIGQPGPKERTWLAKASPEAKRKWNERKANEIMVRKKAAAERVSKMLGKKVKGKTLALIVNAQTRHVDIFEFDGFHARIGWKSDLAKRGYKGSFRY